MSEYKCPLCGGETVGNERFCRSCQQIAKHSIADNIQEKPHARCRTEQNSIKEDPLELKEPIKTEHQVSAIQKLEGKKYLVFKIIVAICIIVSAVSIYFYWEDKSLKREKTYWLECIDQNTSLNYSDYLLRYPNGKFSNTAEEKIRELKNLELTEWNILKFSDDIDAYFAYLEEYPNTPHSATIKNKIDILGWEIALKENSSDSYRSYIENVTLGNYLGGFKNLAAKRYEYHSQLKTLEGKERDTIILRVDHILQTVVRQDTSELKNILANKPKSFFKINGLEKRQLIDSLKYIYQQRKDIPIKLTIDKEETSVIKDIYNTYFISASILEFRDKKSIADTINFELELDQDLNVVKVVKKREENRL